MKINVKYKNLLYVAVFVLLFLAVRLPYLDHDTVNPDGVNWHYRTPQFWNGIKYFQFEKTYQHYHPGVTLMWVSGLAMEAYSFVHQLPDLSVSNFHLYDHVAKISMILAQLVVAVLIFFILSKFFGLHGALILSLLINLEPFFVGNSRLYHMDALFSLLVFAALLTSSISLTRNSRHYALLSGTLFGLSILTKSIGVLLPTFFVVWNAIEWLRNRKTSYRFKLVAVVLFSTLVTIFVLFPALWVRPVYYLTEIFTESERVGIRGGHEQIFFGESEKNPGILFYPLVLLLKLTPFTIIGIFILTLYAHKIKNWASEYEFSSLVRYTLFFTLIYFAVMFFATKKLDRYTLPVFPILCLYAYLGYLSLERVASSQYLKWILATIFILVPLIQFYPYYFLYTSPIFGTPAQANKVIGQKPFGIGVYELKDHILAKYPNDPIIGVYDTKPLKSIYSNSRVVDVRETSPNDYDVLVLAINEKMPDKIVEDGRVEDFKLVETMHFNGLEYWRIYAKR